MSKKPRRRAEPRTPVVSRRVPPRAGHAFVIAALGLLTLVAYANGFGPGFPLDGRGLILQDPRVHAATRENLALILQHTYWWPYGESELYRPLTTLSYLFNYAILGDAQRAAGYHWFNLILHVANVALVYLLGLRLVRRMAPAAFIAGLWAVHPVLTEAVTNIVGRADLLESFAVLAGLLMYLKSTETHAWRRLGWLAGLTAAATVGVFSKESAVVLPGVIVLYEMVWWHERQSLGGLLLGCAVLVPPFFAFWRQRMVVLAASSPSVFPFTDNPLVAADFWTARLTAIKVMARSLGLLVWPQRLSADYSYAQIPLARGSLYDWIAWTVMAASAVAIVLLYWKRRRAAFFAASLAVLTYLPASNLVFPSGTIMAERLLYLPSVGVIACLVLVISAAAGRLRWTPRAPVVVCLVAAAFTVRTWLRNPDWDNELALATSAVKTSPNSFKTHEMLAEALYEADSTQSNLPRVIEEAEKSLAVLDDLPDALNDPEMFRRTAGYYLDQGDHLWRSRPDQQNPPPESVELYRRSVPLLQRAHAILAAVTANLNGSGPQASGADAQSATVDRLLSAAYLRLDEPDQALDTARRARRSAVQDPQTHLQLATVLLAGGRRGEAAVALMAGVLSTANQEVQSQLLNLYQSGLDPDGCAVVRGPEGPTLNSKCPVVHDEMCAASADLMQLHMGNEHADLARQIEDRAVNQYGCSRESLTRDQSGS